MGYDEATARLVPVPGLISPKLDPSMVGALVCPAEAGEMAEWLKAAVC